MQALLTTDGPKQAHELGIILPHEHLFVDLGPIAAASYVHADVEEAVALMTPYLAAVAAQGVTAFVECTPVGVGRRADIDAAIRPRGAGAGCVADGRLSRTLGARLGSRRE